MKKLELFKGVCNETTKMSSDAEFTISSICEESGEFEISIFGIGGKYSAEKATQRFLEMLEVKDK